MYCIFEIAKILLLILGHLKFFENRYLKNSPANRFSESSGIKFTDIQMSCDSVTLFFHWVLFRLSAKYYRPYSKSKLKLSN